MKKQLILILLFAGLFSRGYAANDPTRLYVNGTNGDDSNNGQTWRTALQTLGEALSIAAADVTVSEIWIAQGVYKPTCKFANLEIV